MYDQLTEQDIKKMEEEIEYRKLVVRKEAIEAVKEARAHGDLSENFEYHAAKKDKNRNESRIRYLERMVKTARVIHDDSGEDEVGINNTVEIYFEEDDETEVYRLVTTVRGDSVHGLISIESPLGKAILGHKAGDRVYIKVNDTYGYYIQIRRIEKTRSEAEDKIRSFKSKQRKQRAAAALKVPATNPERRENVCKLNQRLRLLFGEAVPHTDAPCTGMTSCLSMKMSILEKCV